jgi:hypothetical protein
MEPADVTGGKRTMDDKEDIAMGSPNKRALSATGLVSRQQVTPTISMITAENAHEPIEVYRSLTYIGTILRLRMAELHITS